MLNALIIYTVDAATVFIVPQISQLLSRSCSEENRLPKHKKTGAKPRSLVGHC